MIVLVVCSAIAFGILLLLGVVEADAWYRRRKWRKWREKRGGYVDVRPEGDGELG